MDREMKEHGPMYLVQGEFAYRDQAQKALVKAKELEASKKTIPVWYDMNTIRLVDMDKIKRKKMEIIRVKIGKGRLVWMEKSVAKENGFITE